MTTLTLYYTKDDIAALYIPRPVAPPVSDLPNSGYDLVCPNDVVVLPGELAVFDFQVVGVLTDEQGVRQPFFLTPRSSFTKTPLIQQNSPAVIDSSYNGHLQVRLRVIGDEPYLVKAGTALIQIVLPSLRGDYSVILKKGQPSPTERGTGGFGSTGRTA